MAEDDIVARQNYLREAIIDQGYDPAEFIDFLQSARGKHKYTKIEDGDDIGNWTLDELKQQVNLYKKQLGEDVPEGPAQQPHAQQAEPEAETQPEYQAEVPSMPAPTKSKANVTNT